MYSEQNRIEQLEKENERLRRQMEVKYDCLFLQKNLGAAGLSGKERIMSLLVEQQLSKGVSERAACDALDISAATVHRTAHRRLENDGFCI